MHAPWRDSFTPFPPPPPRRLFSTFFSHRFWYLVYSAGAGARRLKCLHYKVCILTWMMYGRMKHGTIFIFTPLKCLRHDLFFLFFFKFTYHLLLRSRRKCTPAQREGSKTTWQSKTKQGSSQRPNRNTEALLFTSEPFQNHGPGFRSPDLVVQSLSHSPLQHSVRGCRPADVRM